MAALVVGGAGLAPPGPQRPAPNLGAFAPTPTEVVERMLKLAEVTRDDVVYDLGSGDGRIVNLAAERHGARGVGVEIDPQLVWFSRRNAKRAQVEHLVRFLNEDALTVDIASATVVTLYLSSKANLLLRPKLQRELRRGARVVSHTHDMGDWWPERVEHVKVRSGEEHILYLWRIALPRDGAVRCGRDLRSAGR
ncbi:MAG: methyltransferase domain-containing protein [Candidatus Rokuibacteriota bacterium]